MSISFIEYSSSPGAIGTNCIIPKPPNLVVGNLMMAHCVWGMAATIYPPDLSWTQIEQAPSQSGDNYQGAVFYKVATSDDTSATNFIFTTKNYDIESSSSDEGVSYANRGVISTFSGQDLEIPIGDSCSRNRSSHNIETGSLFPVPVENYYPNNCMIVFYGQGRTRNSISGWTLSEGDPGLIEKYDLNTPYTATLSMACSVRYANTSFYGSAIIDDPNSVSNVGILVAIQPRDTTDQSSSSSSSSSSISSESSSSLSSESSSSSSSYEEATYYVCGDIDPDVTGEYYYGGYGDPFGIVGSLVENEYNYWTRNIGGIDHYLTNFDDQMIMGTFYYRIISDLEMHYGWVSYSESVLQPIIGDYPYNQESMGTAYVENTPCEEYSSSSSSSTEVSSSSSSSTYAMTSSSSSSSHPISLIVQTSKYESPWPAEGFIQFNLDNTPQENNILLAFTLAHQSIPRNVTPPDASWTNIDTIKYGGYIGMDVWWHKVEIGDGTSYTFNISGMPLEFCSGIIYEVTNIDTTNPVNQHGIIGNTAPTVISSPIVTPSVLNTFAISACCTCVGFADTPPENNPTIDSGWILGPTAVPQWESTFGSYKNSLTTDTVTPISNTFIFGSPQIYDDKAVAIVLLTPEPS